MSVTKIINKDSLLIEQMITWIDELSPYSAVILFMFTLSFFITNIVSKFKTWKDFMHAK